MNRCINIHAVCLSELMNRINARLNQVKSVGQRSFTGYTVVDLVSDLHHCNLRTRINNCLKAF